MKSSNTNNNNQQQHTLLINCETVLRRKRSSAEERVAALTVANRVVVRTLSSLSDSNNAQFQFQFQLSLVLATLFETVFGRNAVFVRRMLQTDGLVGLALSLARCCVGWLAALDAEQQQADNVWAALCIHTQSMARILNESSDPEVCFQIMDIFTQLLSNERGVVSLIENQVLASIVASITKAETCQKRRKPDDPAIPFTPNEPITLINHLISSSDIEESLTHLLTNLVSLFETIEMPLKAEIPPLIIPLLHMIASPPPLPHLLQTICHLLQNKLPQTTQTSLLMLASTAFHILGPSFLFQLRVDSNRSNGVLDFPSDLLISVHHALAETFVLFSRILLICMRLEGGWVGGVFGDDKEGGGGVVKAVVEGLGVWLAEDTEASSIAEGLRNEVVACSVQALYHTRSLTSSWEDVKELWFLSVNALSEIVARGKIFERCWDELMSYWISEACGEIAEQAGDGDEAQFDRESVLGFLKAFTSQ
ncbi:hypothetical protein BCR33DRAFT_857219 [Rhizoclosmatium globosum]|uniref:Neurochondrin-domain-containing protein n=1 Tax=Rhizoclosmatium globosum TaxID=329046 RepID=A0A1Y2B922_9FUNG|nr:hypothetical protein BCR33DRAFT_857219 [Rhizoclosmatium globosum]|eukprot:ORY30977.1 hypothetical protein BCR33DRAFT_857219 [Rhizoclosmatium globosum]